jgi:HlyD family secretion protein
LQESEAVVTGGAPLLEIGDPASLEIVAEFLSQDAALIAPGMSARVEAWGGAQPLSARVTRVEPVARTKISALGVEEQRVNVIAELERGAPSALGHGYRVDLAVIVYREADALRVPTDALVRHGDGWAVYRIENGRVHLRRVVLQEGGERYYSVSQGLSEGDKVVQFPNASMRDGDAVSGRSG